MPDEEQVEERHLRASDESRERVVHELKQGGQTSQVLRRPLIKYTGGALGLFAVPLVLQVAGTGPDAPEEPVPDVLARRTQRAPAEPDFRPLRLMRDPRTRP